MDIEKLNEAIKITHHAAQLIAISGRYLADRREDDSHTAMEFSRSRKILAGVKLKGDQELRVALNIENLDLHILNVRLKSMEKFDLKNRTFEEGFDFLKKRLMTFGLDTSLMLPEVHYNIPDHPAGRGKPFEINDPGAFEQHAVFRSLAKDLLQSFARVFKNTSEILIWPHHFDTGMIIYLDPDEKGDLRGTVGIGLAIKDNMIQEPYFYVNHWSEGKVQYPKELPALKNGRWAESDWKGAYLKLSEIVSGRNELNTEMAADFFSEAIDLSIDFMTA